jgi:hypothetical protein
VGNHSVTYGANAKSTRTSEKKLEGVARLYLAATGLMYRGVYAVTSTDED